SPLPTQPPDEQQESVKRLHLARSVRPAALRLEAERMYADSCPVRSRALALVLELTIWLAAGIAFLVWGTARYRGLTYCPFDHPAIGHPRLIAALIVGSAALLGAFVERMVARRRWQAAAIVGLVMVPLSLVAVYAAALFIGGAHRCLD